MRYLNLLIILIIFAVIIAIIFVISYRSRKTLHEYLNPSTYGNKFNEDLFKPVNKLKADYESKVKNGYQIQATSKVSFIGLAYNLGDKVHDLIDRCVELQKGWQDAQCVIYCYDSTDETYHILNQNKPDWMVLPTDLLTNKKSMNRMTRMANLRNLCLNYIREDDDYVVITDWDLTGPTSRDGIANSLAYLNEGKYDVLTANGIMTTFGLNLHHHIGGWWYYDPFAVKMLNQYRPYLDLRTYKKDYQFRRGEAPIQVISAFGGAAIYKASLFTKHHYRYNPTINDCEHVILHEQMHLDGYRIGINPSMILLSGVQGGS